MDTDRETEKKIEAASETVSQLQSRITMMGEYYPVITRLEKQVVFWRTFAIIMLIIASPFIVILSVSFIRGLL